MARQTNDHANKRAGRTRLAVMLLASIVIFSFTAIVLWALTTLGLIYALATATPLTVIVAGSIVLSDSAADCFAAIVDAIAAAVAAIAEVIGAVVAGILAALAAVFTIFGG